ncbi:substrate-binding domain-containing protein [Roseibium sp. MMSF_3412]|uniref:substrate-binding domain-containing protein n=1 Tax=Roseibium sp. MMSF_3412 TaxID=3046712 RepID=UPI00273DCFFD|nr:substrate-binding domain-containing protein [Roseibium sp. MMSF_3412]
MIKKQRQKRILDILRKEGVLDLNDLSRTLPEVSKVTLRRDVAELADAGALKKTHGGAVFPDADLVGANKAPVETPESEFASLVDRLDAIILPPITGRGADALRRQVIRRGIPFVAESALQLGGAYLGPDNRKAAMELGIEAAGHLTDSEVSLLIVGQPELTNTRDRAQGFEDGLKKRFERGVKTVHVNGQGTYKTAYRVALDALKAHEDISVVFAVNDHSAVAAIEAADALDRRISVYSTGGESADFLKRLAPDGPLKAVAAFFPEIVGAIAIRNIIADATGMGSLKPTQTPHATLTAANVSSFYDTGTSALLPARRDEFLLQEQGPRALPKANLKIGFLPHYPAHDWYRIMIQSMRETAALHGCELVIAPPHHGIAAELTRLRREIATQAADRIESGSTVILGEGEATLLLAEEIRSRSHHQSETLSGLTIITNSLDVMHCLQGVTSLKIIMTSGEYQAADRCLVGPSLGALFELMRADAAFLSVSGVSPDFGITQVDERLALVGSRFVKAARRTIVLADHTLVGSDANYRIVGTAQIHEVITDDGALLDDRQRLRAVGVEVLIAGEETEDPTQPASQPDLRAVQRG